ncbi:MAG: LPS assembly lipoprotein LptE [Syntrophales bacterium]
MKRSKRQFFWLIVLVMTSLWACGYHFVGTGGDGIDPAIKRVHVVTFGNATNEPNVENTFRAAFTDRFIQGGRFQIVDQTAQADAVLKGKIKFLVRTPLAYTAGNLASEERWTVTVDLSFEERETGKVLWANSDFGLTGDYKVSSSSLSVTERNRKEALVKLAGDTAERAYSMILSGF